MPEPPRFGGGDDRVSFKDMEATETTCALLATLMHDTKLRCIEDDETCWQINWCNVRVPDKAAQVRGQCAGYFHAFLYT